MLETRSSILDALREAEASDDVILKSVTDAWPSPTASKSCELTVVVPVFNEEEALRPLDAEIRAALRSTGRSAEIIYVDDGSRDGSLAVLKELCAAAEGTDIPTRVVVFRRNYGQTAAMSAGFEIARGAVVFPLDADGQNNPADIPALLAEYEKGYDIVSGWRKRRQDKASRKLPSRIANWLIGRVSGVRLHDYGCTLKAYRGSLLKELPLYGEMHRFIPLYLATIGAKVTELPVDHRPRTSGMSKYGSRRIFTVLLDLLLILFMSRYYNRPMHFFGQVALGFVALLMLCIGGILLLNCHVLSLFGIDDYPSFKQTPLPEMAASFMIAAVISAFFGILAEILIRVRYEASGVRPYAIRTIVDSRRLAAAESDQP